MSYILPWGVFIKALHVLLLELSFKFVYFLAYPRGTHAFNFFVYICLQDKYESLLEIVKDDLARNLVALLSPERRLATFSSALWISYLVFATQRKHLKYQVGLLIFSKVI